MSSQSEKIIALEAKINALQSLFLGNRDNGMWHVLAGNHILYGCAVKASPMWDVTYPFLLSLYAPSSDGSYPINGDYSATATRPEHYANGAFIYGSPFLTQDVNETAVDLTTLVVATPPTTANHVRHDLVYIAVGTSGPVIQVATGTSWNNVDSSLAITASDNDPSIPLGAVSIARVRVTIGDADATNLSFHDLRDFATRLGFPVTNLTTYADNTAALAGGLVAGELYKTSTGSVQVVY